MLFSAFPHSSKKWLGVYLVNNSDSEDVVHPYELRVTNYLLDTHDALQFPVFPLMRMPTFRNYFKTITTEPMQMSLQKIILLPWSPHMAGPLFHRLARDLFFPQDTTKLWGRGRLPRTSLTEIIAFPHIV